MVRMREAGSKSAGDKFMKSRLWLDDLYVKPLHNHFTTRERWAMFQRRNPGFWKVVAWAVMLITAVTFWAVIVRAII
jgi:hypothetical protein